MSDDLFENTPTRWITITCIALLVGLTLGVSVATPDKSVPLSDDVGEEQPGTVDCRLNWNESFMLCFTSGDVNLTVNGDVAGESGVMNMSDLPRET